MSRVFLKPVHHEINISGHLPPETVKGLCRMLRRAVRTALDL